MWILIINDIKLVLWTLHRENCSSDCFYTQVNYGFYLKCSHFRVNPLLFVSNAVMQPSEKSSDKWLVKTPSVTDSAKWTVVLISERHFVFIFYQFTNLIIGSNNLKGIKI